MSSQDYRKAILDRLLTKYNNRYAKNIITNKRIIIKPTEIYKEYARNNADISEKQRINDAVYELSSKGFIIVEHLKFSNDIEKIYLSEDRLGVIYEFLKDEYGVIPQSTISERMHEIIKGYIGTGGLCRSIVKVFLGKLKIQDVHWFRKKLKQI